MWEATVLFKVNIEFIEQYIKISKFDREVSESLSENEEDIDFLEDSAQIGSQPSDYFGLKNIERDLSSTENDAFCQCDIDDSLNSDVDTRNYVHLDMIQNRTI